MALDERKTAEVIETMKRFLNKRRPPENIRHQLDLCYKIEQQSVVIFGDKSCYLIIVTTLSNLRSFHCPA